MNEGSKPTPSCPTCGEGGRPVKAVTLKSLLRPEALGKVSSDASWRFCATPDCATVYYDETGTTSFAKSDLTVRVGIKEDTAPRPICYCFDHGIEEIEEQIRATGKTTVPDDIKTRMQDGCWCETKSPMGSCCLATVTKHVKAAEKKFGGSAPESDAALPVEDCCASHTVSESAATSGKSAMTEKVAWVGGILSAVIASACCWLPLLLVAVGVSGAAVSAAFEAYRPYFMALTIAFLGTAFYFAYRPRRSCATDSNADSCCPPSKTGGGTLQTVNRSVLWLVTVVAAAFLFFPSYVGLLTGSGDSLSGRDDLDKTALKIDGMTCESCAAGLEKTLRKLPGVTAAEVSYDEQSAVIGFAKGTEIDREPILAAVKAAGFTGRFNDLTRQEFPIEGMTCEACATHTQANIAGIPGVVRAEVRYDEKKAIVPTDSTVSSNAIVKSIEASGYRVSTESKEKSSPESEPIKP